jgi:hypothetical protein
MQPKKEEFVTLEVSQMGFVIRGIGPGAHKCTYRGEPLVDFLEKLWKKFAPLKNKLNTAWDSLDKTDSKNPANAEHIQTIMAAGSWAFALILELQPFTRKCLYGPTDPLRSLYILRLEEICTKCFAAAHLYGQPDESMVGLRGLLIDFETNGGINLKTGEKGCGFDTSIRTYFVAYFAHTSREAIIYERFGDLLEAIGMQIKEQYPKVGAPFEAELGRMLQEGNHGFAGKEFQSEAKTGLIKRITTLKESFVTSDKVELEKAA